MLGIRLSPSTFARALWWWIKRQLHTYKEVAPLIGLAYALWRRRTAAVALQEGRFMQQCTFILVDTQGLLKSESKVLRYVTVPTLFSRTLRALMFDNAQLVERVSEAAGCTTAAAPLLELGALGTYVMANINAHLMEICNAAGHAAAACGQDIEIIKVLFGLVNDRTTSARRQLRVYVVKETQLRSLPSEEQLDLQRASRKNAYAMLRAMAAACHEEAAEVDSEINLGITTGLPSGMGRTWLVVPKYPQGAILETKRSSLHSAL